MAERVSVVVPSLNGPLVEETVAALELQTIAGPGLEIVVAGRDDAGRVRGREGVRFVEAGGEATAAENRNLGAARAAGELLLFTDADCRPRPEWAERLAAALERSPIAGGGVEFALDANRWAVADNIASFHELLDRPRENDTRAPIGSLNLGVRREIWEESWGGIQGFDPRLPTSEDHDWALRARQAGHAIGFEPAAVVRHAAVRSSRAELEAHARWYGASFPRFVRKHGLGLLRQELGLGEGWDDPARLARRRRRKALAGAVAIFRRHPRLRRAWRSFPGVVRFKLAWYRAVIESWS